MEAILAILAAMAPAVGLLLLGWVKKKQDPKTIILEQKNENRTAIANGTAGELLAQRLDRLGPK